MILPFSRPRVAGSYYIDMNSDQLAHSRATAGATRGKSDYLNRSGADTRLFRLKCPNSLATFRRPEKPCQANAGFRVAGAIGRWMIDGDGEMEEPTCN